jgi:hypothetical protein
MVFKNLPGFRRFAFTSITFPQHVILIGHQRCPDGSSRALSSLSRGSHL